MEKPSRVARAAQGFGIGALVAVFVGPMLAHFELVPPMAGFRVFALGLLLALVAALVGGIGAWLGSGRSRATALRGFGLGALVLLILVLMLTRSARYPRINDITTDTQEPPRFETAQSLAANQGRDMQYPGAAFAEQQRQGYPELGPHHLPAPPAEAFPHVREVAERFPTWTITRVDASDHEIEGYATTWLFRFHDDFVIEVRPSDGGSVVHMRSKSRDGKGDLGANAARIRSFFADLG